MANPKPVPRQAKHHIAPQIRMWSAAGLRKLAQRQKITVPELFANWFEADPAGMLRAVSRFSVRESEVTGTMQHEHSHRHTHEPISETVGWIEGVLGDAEEGEITEPMQARPVLPAPVRAEEA